MRKRRGAIRACLGVADHLSATLRRENLVLYLSQRHSKRTCRLASRYPFYAERHAKKAVNNLPTGLTGLGIEPRILPIQKQTLYPLGHSIDKLNSLLP